MPDDRYDRPGTEPAFEVRHESAPGDALVAGFSNFGLAGLTAVDFLVDHLELEERGHVTVDQLPAVTPFEGGTPRHHTRFFSESGLDVTVLTGELFVPLFAVDAFADAVVDWLADNDVSEVTLLSGVPVAHGPDEHRVFYVATEDYREEHLADSSIPPMGNGFLDGVNAALVNRGIDSSLSVGVLVTPVHAQAPDVDAALRLLDGARSVHGLDVDTGPLEAFAEEVREYYQELADHLAEAPEQQRPEDRMYM
jgi:uncharacterized protein